VNDDVAVLSYGDHTYYIALDHIVWFQEWYAAPEAEPEFRSDFH
jgi:hypothetical protein